MRATARILTRFAISLFMVLTAFASIGSAEIDDSAVFVEAFNAYQQKDFLLAIEKCDQLNQAFPDSPLRDVTLLLIARASIKSGDNERAAKSVALFTAEFPESSLKTSVEDELKTLASRHQKGETLPPDKSLQASARKVRADKLALQRAAEAKLEQERLSKIKAEQDRLARIKLEEERREKERILAEKLAKASIKAVILIHENAGAVSVGSGGSIPVEITNKGKNSEEFLLNVSAAKEYDSILTGAGKPEENITSIQLAAGQTFNGMLRFRMPAEMVDGHRTGVSIKVTSAKFGDISFQKDAVIVSSAPLVRTVAKLSKQKVTAGEKLRYRVTVLNAGSLTAQDLTVRLQLPQQIDFLGAPDVNFKQESDGTLIFKVDQVEVGKLVEYNLDVMIRENASAGQELRGHVEVVNGTLQRKDIFTASASLVQAK